MVYEHGATYLYILGDGTFYLHNPISLPFAENARLRVGRLQPEELSALIADLGGLDEVRALQGSYVDGESFDASRDLLLVDGMTSPILCETLCMGARPEPVLAALQEWIETVGAAASRDIEASDLRFVAQPLGRFETPWESGNAVPPHPISLELLALGVRERGYLEPFDSALVTGGAAETLERLIRDHHEMIESSETFLTDQTLYVRSGVGEPVYQMFFRDRLPGAETQEGAIEDIVLLPSVPE